MIKRLIKTCGGIPIKLSLELFDKIVVPILVYGAEVWGTKSREKIELVQRNFCKYILNVPNKTSNAATLGDLGRKPLSVIYKYKSIKFWLKIVQDDHRLIRNSSYRMLKTFSENRNCSNWVSDIKQMLYTYGFGDVWLRQNVGHPELFLTTFKQRLADNAFQNWHEELENNSKLSYYKDFKSLLNFEIYLSVDMYWTHRAALARFRCGSHKLSIERLRYTNCERNQRLCKYCQTLNIQCIEDEYHFLLICPLYSELRNKYLGRYFRNDYPSIDKFNRILNCTKVNELKDLGAFVYYAMILYSDYNGL